MPDHGCLACGDLLLQAGRAIRRHLIAVSRLEEAVIRAAGDDVGSLQVQVLDSAIARENAVRAYENHTQIHQSKVNHAGS